MLLLHFYTKGEVCQTRPSPYGDWAELCTYDTYLSSTLPYMHRRKKNSNWYAPVFELNDDPALSVHFPDGTWCHNDGDSDFFCRCCHEQIFIVRNFLLIVI